MAAPPRPGQARTEGIAGDMAFKRRCTDGGTDSFALVTVSGGATYGRLTVAAPGKGNLRVYVLDGAGRIGTEGPYLR